MRFLVLAVVAHSSLLKKRVSIDSENVLTQVFGNLRGFLSNSEHLINVLQVLSDYDEETRIVMSYLMDKHFTNLEQLVDDFVFIEDQVPAAISQLSFRSMVVFSSGDIHSLRFIRNRFLYYGAQMKKCLYSHLPLGLRLNYDNYFRHVENPEALHQRKISTTTCALEHIYTVSGQAYVPFSFLPSERVAVQVAAGEARLWLPRSRDFIPLSSRVVTAAVVASSRPGVFFLQTTRAMPNQEGWDDIFVSTDFSKAKASGGFLGIIGDSAVDAFSGLEVTQLLD